MKTFDELYEMYKHRDENIYLELFAGVNFEDLYRECSKDLAKYCEFGAWLMYTSEVYNDMLNEDTAFLEEE